MAPFHADHVVSVELRRHESLNDAGLALVEACLQVERHVLTCDVICLKGYPFLASVDISLRHVVVADCSWVLFHSLITLEESLVNFLQPDIVRIFLQNVTLLR